MLKALALLVIATAFLGCANLSTRKVMPLDRFQRIYVQTSLTDNHHLSEYLVAELRRHGREASSGPRTMMPETTDAVLTYTDRWAWDFKDYLIELTVEVHTARANKKLADGRYYQPSIKTKATEAVVAEIITPLFRKS